MRKICSCYLIFKFILWIKRVCHIVHVDFIKQVLKDDVFVIVMGVKSEIVAQTWNILE